MPLWVWTIAVAGVMGLLVSLGSVLLYADEHGQQDRPDWTWDARIFFFDVVPQSREEADELLDRFQEYGYTVVGIVRPDLGEPRPVSAEDPRLYWPPVWEWDWSHTSEQNEVLKYFAEEAHKRGIRTMYHNMVWSINAVDYKGEGISIKPEWLPLTQQNTQGEPTFEGVYTAHPSQWSPEHVAHVWLCPLAPTVLQAVEDNVSQMVEDLGIDVFIGDWGFHGYTCASPEFERAFEEDTGWRQPEAGSTGGPGSSVKGDWVQGGLLVRATAGLANKLRGAEPSKVIFAYSSDPTGGVYETYPEFADILGDEVLARSSFYDWSWQMAMLKYNFAISYRYNVPVTEYYYTDTYSENLFAWALTHAVGLKMWRLLPWFSQWEAEHAALLNRPRPAKADVALLFSRQTAVRYSASAGVYWSGSADDGQLHHPYVSGRFDTRQEGTEGWAGWARVLQDLHQPYDVILDADVTPERLSSYRVLILSNAAALSDQQIHAFREFVRSGGTLVSTYQTSLFDEQGQQRPEFGLADVMGVSYQAIVPPLGSWLAGDGGPSFFDDVLREAEGTPREPQWAVRVTKSPDARALAYHLSGSDVIPALVLNQFGDGQSLYFAGYPGSKTFFRRKPVTRPDKIQEFVYRDYTDPFYRSLLEAIMTRAVPEPYVDTDLPPEIIVNPLRCGEEGEQQLCLHLLNALGSRPADGASIANVPGIPPRFDLSAEAALEMEATGSGDSGYGAGFVVPFPEVQGPLTIRVRDLGLTGGYVVSPDFEGEQPVALHREGPYTVVEVPNLQRYSIVVLQMTPPGESVPATPLPSPDFGPALAVEQKSSSPLPTSTPAPTAATAAAGAPGLPALPAAGGPSSRSAEEQEQAGWSLPLPGWAVGAVVATLVIIGAAVVSQRRGRR